MQRGGRLAEFIVATATDVDMSVPRDEWAAFDLVTKQGIKIEVKSAAYVQSWFQRALSKISFSIKAALYWDSHTNEQSKTAIRSADVYVFCLLHLQDKQVVNPLNLNHWEFYVLSTKELDNYTRSTSSITLKSLQKLTSAIPYNDLIDVVQRKCSANN